MRSRKLVIITITDTQKTGHAAYLRRHLSAARRMVRGGLRSLSIALVDDQTMADLHHRFLGLSNPTDVLSFELDYDAENRVNSGEIVVCVPEARRRSRGSGVGLRQELLLYCLHGMLHLCGYDDRTRGAFDRMHRTEDMILTKLGVGKVFASGNSPRDRGATSGRPRRRSKGTLR